MLQPLNSHRRDFVQPVTPTSSVSDQLHDQGNLTHADLETIAKLEKLDASGKSTDKDEFNETSWQILAELESKKMDVEMNKRVQRLIEMWQFNHARKKIQKTLSSSETGEKIDIGG